MRSVVRQVTGCDISDASEDNINIHHNYCSCERCRYLCRVTGRIVEEEVWVTRKGATSARKGQLGIIPGAMGTYSYIVRGKGNPESWYSCSHGAGRRLSRTEAYKRISQEDFESSMTGIFLLLM